MENHTERISEKEILRRQMELLAKKSTYIGCTLSELSECTMAMCEIYKLIYLDDTLDQLKSEL